MAKTKLSDAVEDFGRFRRSQGLSRNTVQNDETTLRSLLASVGNIYVDNITDRHVSTWATDRASRLVPSSLRNDHQRATQFFEWCRRTKRCHRDHDPMAGRKAPKITDREMPRVHVSKFPHLLDLAGQRSPRDRALVALGLFAMLREQEIATLRVRDLDLDAGWLLARIHKTYEEDRLGISQALDQEMRLWLKSYAEICGPLDPDWYLVPAVGLNRPRDPHTGRMMALTGDMLEPTRKLGKAATILKPSLLATGLEDHRLGGHTLRRSGARALYDLLVTVEGVDALRITQTMLHHKDPVVTQRYIGLKQDRDTRDSLLRDRVVYGFENVSRIVSGVNHGEDTSVAVGM